MQKTVAIVVIAHLFLLLFALLDQAPQVHMLRTPISVKAVHLATQTAPQKPIPIAKAKKPKPVSQKKEKTADFARQKALKAAQKSLASIAKTDEKTAQAAPVQLASLALAEASYEEALVQRLRAQLRLPEYGRVRIALTLDRAGEVVQVKILESQSSINQKYVEKELPLLRFAGFGRRFGEEKSRKFLIVLANE